MGEPSRSKALRAAQYLRMSTEGQQYSPELQAAFVGTYAEERGYEIVRTFEDLGISGLTLKRREGLKALLNTIVSGAADFDHLLIYDVSRWGRFQDPDEAAHYEFLCREAGIKVEYCAELFDNDGSLMAAIMKCLCRVKAAEYSRDLSGKVHRAHHRLARAGYWQGGPAPYGLRRRVITKGGDLRFEAKPGEWKAIHDNRTVLAPGPIEELKVVRRIFRLFVMSDLSPGEIAKRLKRSRVASGSALGWTENQVRGILGNWAFVGELVYGKTRSRLAGGSRRLPKTEWMHVPGALPKIVPQSQFDAAQRRLAPKASATDEELLEDLRIIVRQTGHVTARDLGSKSGAHCQNVYIRRFGSLKAAYALIGYRQTWKRRTGCMDALAPWLEQVLRAEWARPSRERQSLPQLWAAARGRGYLGGLSHFRHWTRKWEAERDLRRARPRVDGLSDVALLERLAALWVREGRVSTKLIDADPALPTPTTIYKRLGGLRRAYDLIGYPQPAIGKHPRGMGPQTSAP